MNVMVEQSLIAKIRALSPQQVAKVEDFVEFLAAKARKRHGLAQLLTIAPALQAATAQPISEDELTVEIQAVRSARRPKHPKTSFLPPTLPCKKGQN